MNITSRSYDDARVRFESVRNPLAKIGARAVELLVERIKDPDRPAHQVRLAGVLHSGETCGPPAGQAQGVWRPNGPRRAGPSNGEI